MRLAQISTTLLFALGGLIVPMGEAFAGVGGGGGLCAGFSSGQELVMLDNCFNGVAHFSPGGSTLLVKNDGALPHTLTAVDGSFDTGIVQPGETAEIRVGEDGISRVYCTLHGSAHGADMAGVLVVGDVRPVVGGAVSKPNAGLAVGVTSDPGAISLDDAQEGMGQVRNAARLTILTVIAVGATTGTLIVALNRKIASILIGQDTGNDAAMS